MRYRDGALAPGSLPKMPRTSVTDQDIARARDSIFVSYIAGTNFLMMLSDLWDWRITWKKLLQEKSDTFVEVK